MARKILLLATIVFVGALIGQVTATKVVIASEDTIITHRIDEIEALDEEKIEEAIEKTIDEALADIDIDLDSNAKVIRVIHRQVRDAMDEAFDIDKIPPGARGFYHPIMKNDFGNSWHQTAILFAVIIFLGWKVIFFIMWIISLCVIGRGFTKIARSNEREKEK